MSDDSAAVRIRAKLRTRCACGTWVHPGEQILWAPGAKQTVGCSSCSPSSTEQHPDPHMNIDRWR